MKFRAIILIMLILALLAIFRFIRRKELQLKYSLVWIVVDLLMIVAVSVPGILNYIAKLLGVYSITNMLFFLGIMFMLAICFSLTVALSRASDRIRQLSQQVAINEYKTRECDEVNNKVVTEDCE